MGNLVFGPRQSLYGRQARRQFRLSLIFGVPCIVAYASILSDKANYAPCDSSSESFRWGYANWIYTIVNTAISCSIIPYCIIQAGKMGEIKEERAQRKWIFLKVIILLLLLMGTLVVYLGVCYSYSTGEECSHLTHMNLSCIIMFPIIITAIIALIIFKTLRKKKKNTHIEANHQENINF